MWNCGGSGAEITRQCRGPSRRGCFLCSRAGAAPARPPIGIKLFPHPRSHRVGKLDDAQLVKGLVPGTRTDTFVLGDLAEAKRIAEHALDVATRFSEAVIRQDPEAAYQYCADEWKKAAPLKKCIAELHKADEKYAGKPVAWRPERITWIYAEPTWREESNKEGDWPKDTPKQNKRALVGGSWTTGRTEQGESGRSVFFWVTEQTDGY